MFAIVKAVMYAAIAAILVVIAILAVLVLAKLLLAGEMGDQFEIFDDFTKRALWVFPLGMLMLVIFSQGLGLIMRQTTGAVALSLILYLGIDGMVTMIPKIGEDRSEEHTSELQSRGHLVCRLLLDTTTQSRHR